MLLPQLMAQHPPLYLLQTWPLLALLPLRNLLLLRLRGPEPEAELRLRLELAARSPLAARLTVDRLLAPLPLPLPLPLLVGRAHQTLQHIGRKLIHCGRRTVAMSTAERSKMAKSTEKKNKKTAVMSLGPVTFFRRVRKRTRADGPGRPVFSH